MKISSPKPAPASRPAAPPKASAAKNGNTGIVPPSTGKNTGIVPPSQSKPADGFQPTKPATGTGSTPAANGNSGIVPATGKGGTAATSGAAATSLSGAQATTYTLPANLEQFRAIFDKEGERIAKLPRQAQEPQIIHTSDRLFKDLKDFATLDEIDKGLREAVAYYSRRSSGNDPMTYAMAADSAAGFGNGTSSKDEIGGGTPFAPELPANDTGSTLPSVKEEQPEEELQQQFRRMRRRFF